MARVFTVTCKFPLDERDVESIEQALFNGVLKAAESRGLIATNEDVNVENEEIEIVEEND